MATYSDQFIEAVNPVTLPVKKTGSILNTDSGNGLDTRPASELTKDELAARAGVDVSRVVENPTGGFMIGPNLNLQPGVISDTSDKKAEITQTGTDINKMMSPAITLPSTEVLNKTLDQITKQMEERRKQLETRRTEDVMGIEKGFETTRGELELKQEKEFEQATGRIRTGGFFTSMERDQLLDLQRAHRLEIANLEGQKFSILNQAKRAYEDQDFDLAKEQLQLVRDIEKESYSRNQQYFQNIMQTQRFWKEMNKPIIEAEQADVDQLLSYMELAPSVFLDIRPSDIMLGRITRGEIISRYLDSKEYQTGLVQRGAIGGGGINRSVESWANLLATGQANISNIPTNIRNSVVSYLQDQGIQVGKPLSDTAITHINQTEFALTSLNDLRSIINSNLQYVGPISGWQKLNPWSKARQVQADIDRVRQTVGKALEGGVLRKEDEEKYKKILATITDMPETAIYKIDALISSITRNIGNYKTLQSESGRFVPDKFRIEVPKVEDLRIKYNY